MLRSRRTLAGACTLLVLGACGEAAREPEPFVARDGGTTRDAGFEDAAADAGFADGGFTDAAIDPLNLGWIGGACSGATDCAYAGAVCLGEADGFPAGTCSLPCTRVCPDSEEAQHSQTFCISARGGGEGTCVSRCDYTLSPATGCRTGYGCIAVPRKSEPDRIEEVCLPLDATGVAQPLNDLQPALERAAIAAGIEAERAVLLDVTDPAAPVVASLRALEPVYPASVIKVVVMAEVERQIERGMLSLSAQYTVTEEQDTCETLPSSDPRPPLVTGDTATVEHYVDVMITRSDNTATNVLIDNVGRENMTAFMAALGLPGLRVHRKVFGCEPYDDSGWDGTNLNSMTALETAELYRLILDGGPGFVGEEGRLRMQAILSRQLLRGTIAAGLPEDAQYLSKTGNTSVVIHDSGIILWGGQRYIVAVFLELSPSEGRPLLREFGHQLGHLMTARQ